MDEDPDIDIEETTFIYPRIESIYSDVNIKEEPLDDGEDEYQSMEIEQPSSDYYMPIRNKIILGSKPPSLVLSEPTAGPSTASDNWEDQDNFFECAECNLLYPTQNELDSHKMTSHSFLVARPLSRAIKSERRVSVSSNNSRSYLEDTSSQEKTIRRQKALKSTAKSALNKTFPMPHNLRTNRSYGDKSPVAMIQKNDSDMGDVLLCKHCDVRFPDEIALIKHTYELLPEASLKCEICQMSFDSRPALRGHMAKHSRKTGEVASKDNDMLIQCGYCTCYLMYEGFMRTHLLKNHKVTDYEVKHVKYSGKCAICSKVLRDYKIHNKHLLKYHRKVFMSKTRFQFDVGPIKMKCTMCSQIFTSRYAAYKHKAEKHPEKTHKHMFHTVNEKPIKQLPANLPSITQAPKPKPQSKPVLVSKTHIPKQNLFKCNKCQIHFVSCSAAFAHSKRCSLAKGDWKCSKCRRTFTKTEKLQHMQQHQFSEKFQVHVVSDKILSQVLCRCPKCELLFDEISFAEHVSADCVPKNGLDCKSCDLKIHLDSYAKHMRYHSKYNFSSADFIIIDFVDTSFQNAPIKEEKKREFRQKLVYCSTCNSHCYAKRVKQKYHMEGRCKTLKKRLCTTCGLSFAVKTFNKHVSHDHETLNLKLNEIKFVRLQDSKPINPVMPTFYQCEKCDVLFISPLHKTNHNCSKIMYEHCSKCLKKYDTVSYDLHLSFHNYGHSKTEVKKASAIKLKFYACVSCNYGFHNYDGVVEHCQQHYTNSEDLATRHCRICKLSYAELHKMAHSSANIDILKFNHEKMLTEDWMTGFGSLSKVEVEDILSKSIYSGMRNVRLELLIEGPAERTIYRCANCQLHFDQDYVLDHTMESCVGTPRFACSSCNAAFNTRVAKSNHMNVHVIYGDDITFREIVFNNENDKELNEALRIGRQKESLKFRKCQQCKLLIKKSEYEAHISAHNKVDVKVLKSSPNEVEVKQFTCRRYDKNVTCKLFKPVNGAKKMYTIYKCKTCKGCIMKKDNLARHQCGPTDRYGKCHKCSLYFLPCNLKKHLELHNLIPKFTLKNFSIQEFQLVKSPINSKKRRRYSSDDDASTGAGVKVNVSKTYDTRKVVGRPYSDNLSEDSQDSILNESSEETLSSNTYAKKYIKKSCVDKVDSDNEIDVSKVKVEYTPGKKKDLSDSTLDMERWRIEMKNKLYQCEKCYVCFSHKQLLVTHLSACDDTILSETPLSCDQCDMVFHPSLTTFHEKLHELVRQNPIENYFYLVNVSTNGVHTNVEMRWLYKCQPCNIHYLNIRSLERHYSFNHVVSDSVDCEICGLKFTKASRTRHMRIQHEEGELSREDLHIEIADKKIVGEGEVHLKAFVKARPLIRECTIDIEAMDNHKVGFSPIKREDSMDTETSVSVSTEYFQDDSNTPSSKEIENNIHVSADEYDKIDHHLYKCNQCSKLYITEQTLLRHIMEGNHKAKPSDCDLCGLTFSEGTLPIHKSRQHEELKLSRDDFVINNMKQISDSKVLNESDALFEKSLPRTEQNAELSEELKEVTKQMKTYVAGPIDNHIYKCLECSVFYTNRRRLLLHIIIEKHQQFGFSRCDICGLMFGNCSITKHKNVQHEKLNLTRKDFIISDVFGSRLPDDVDSVQSDIKYASSISTDDLPYSVTELEDKIDNKESLEVKKETEIKIFKLYQCKDCKICVQKPERKLHVCCSDIQKKQCIKCCLYFKCTDVAQHKRLHCKYRELSRRNFVLIRFGRRTSRHHKIYKCVRCSTHFMSLNTLEWHMNTFNHQTKREYCNICGLFFGKYSLSRHIYIDHNQLNLTVEQLNIIYVSDKNSPNMEDKQKGANLNKCNNTTVSDPETTLNVKTVKKLFKCVECDVYFLTRASYCHHIYNHKKLDDTEYIDCNICDFQFLNESLGVHMKTHKDKSFCLDKLLIEEYQANSTDLPKIELYFAKDSLNSKLVSTTTPFDNDDENVLSQTDEQLSVIDSTSDELPKAMTDKKIGLDDNSFARNTDSSREEVNPVVEPNSDGTVKLSD